MGKIVKLKEAITLIWETIKTSEEQGEMIEYPYIFIIGAGISAPQVLTARGIISHCQERVKDLYKDDTVELKNVLNRAETLMANSAKYYSYWFEQAYKNKIHRQQYLKSIISNSRISTSNLLLAQILNNKKISTTVITPNFDNHLLKSLNLLGNYDVFSAKNVLDNIALNKNSKTLQIVHVHGTYEFYDCCNLENEITKIAHGQGIKTTAGTIEEFLKTQSPIVIGYSGWEDDVIMSKLKERLEYAALPYSLIWFCYSKNDYEILPDWLKVNDDVIFVLPDIKEDVKDSMGEISQEAFLPAEDVLNALITKFGFEAPNLFSNPIQYYIELIDGFLPENIEIFPLTAWKRRLDHIEGYLDDIDKQIIMLDAAAARKDIVDITNILRKIDYSFIPIDDMEHILSGVVLPLLNSKNRIEDINDLIMFLYSVQDLLHIRRNDITYDKLSLYLMKILGLTENYKEKIENANLIEIYDKILDICVHESKCEDIELLVLGMKSEIVDHENKILLRKEVIERGKKSIENEKIARLMLIAAFKQIKDQESEKEYYLEIIDLIIRGHNNNKKILEVYYILIIQLIEHGIDFSISSNNLLVQIDENDLPQYVSLYARRVYCTKEENIEKKTKMASEAIDQFDIENIENCSICTDYAILLRYAFLGKIFLQEAIEQKYLDYVFKLCNKDKGCSFVSEIIVEIMDAYINNTQSQYEKRELCKKVINMCESWNMYEEWGYFNQLYVENLDKKECEIYLKENERYRDFREAIEKVSDAIHAYVSHDIALCKDILLEASECFDNMFEGRYNPALINICFMARRDEIPELNISVLDVMKSITWMDNNAILNINKALAYIIQDDWGDAIQEIKNIKWNFEEALQWWKQEDVVGKKEKSLVMALLILENRIYANAETLEDLDFAINYITMPEDIKEELKNIKTNFLKE